MSKHCDGCRSCPGTKLYSSCSYIDLNQNSECPCSLCVVKVMCGVGCNLFETFEMHCVDLLGAMTMKEGYKIRGKDYV